jgi:DNA-binding HxlR family transcriptional regulator
MRAGARVLLMATDPINRGILRSMLDRPVAMDGDLYKVSSGGREVLFVAFVAERWLQSAPQGPIDFEGDEAAAAIAALANGWSGTVMHMLAPEPLGFDELRRAVDGVGTRALRRLLSAMQHAGQVVAHGTGKDTTYAITDWLRAGLAPLATAARVERRQSIEGTTPIDALDVEAAFHLSLPMLELPKELSGTCRLGVNLEDGEGSALTGVTARIEAGRVVSCVTGLDGSADAWAAGPADDWLDTVIEPDAKRVRTGGDRWLASALLDRLHKTLFGIPVI